MPKTLIIAAEIAIIITTKIVGNSGSFTTNRNEYIVGL